MADLIDASNSPPIPNPFRGRYWGVPLTPAPSPRKEGKGKSPHLSPCLFTGEGFGEGDTTTIFKLPALERLGGRRNPSPFYRSPRFIFSIIGSIFLLLALSACGGLAGEPRIVSTSAL